MAVTKRYLKTRQVCKTKFTLTRDIAGEADKAYLVGDFNDWDIQKHPLQKLKNGDFTITLDLPCDCHTEYQFRYMLYFPKGINWENEPDADKHVPSPYIDTNNSVIIVNPQ